MENLDPNKRNAASGFAVLHDWLQAKWGIEPAQSFPRAWMRVTRQAYGQCMVNQSMIMTPLVIGTTEFTRGLAVHSCSEIHVVLPSPARSFHAFVGRDQNAGCFGELANIHFRVSVGERDLYESPLIQGGEEPLAVEVDLGGASEITLRVGDRADWGHGDWADARVVLENGETLWLDELPFEGMAPDCSAVPPISFQYEGRSFLDDSAAWKPAVQSEALDADRARHVVTYRHPSTTLEVRCEIVVYRELSAVEWVVHFTNTGSTSLGAISDIKSLDMHLSRALWAKECVLHHAIGSICAERDFAPLEKMLEPQSTFRLAPEGGRSSSGTLPFFNLESTGGGVIAGIGWSGQWQADFQRDRETGIHVQIGMEKTHIELSPGETMRTPGTLLLFWKGDRTRAHNAWRSLILSHYSPRPSGRPVEVPISFVTWGMLSEQELVRRNEVISRSKAAFDTYWIDAGWFGECVEVGDWYKQAGNWKPNSALLPHGLKPVADAVHESGRKFLLWFDCERVYHGSELHREHPEWLLDLEPEKQIGYPDGANQNYLFNLGCPEARRFMTEMISAAISELGIEVLRQDFNIDPLLFWQKADASNRQGMAEIRYVEGLYAFWDELLARHPHLLIDNCASGGRRLDFEMARRSVPLWRSDLQCCPDYSALGTQSQTFGLAPWLPLSCAGVRTYGDTYDFRSGLGSGTVGFWLPKSIEDDPAWVEARIAESHLVRPYFHGDFYPLTNYSLASDIWLVFQLDRSDLGEGVVLAFRRENAPYPMANVALKGLLPEASYEIIDADAAGTSVVSGETLNTEGLNIHLPTRRSSALITYRKIK